MIRHVRNGSPDWEHSAKKNDEPKLHHKLHVVAEDIWLIIYQQ